MTNLETALGRLGSTERRALTVACAQQRDRSDSRVLAEVWFQLATLAANVEDRERAALRAAEDDLLGPVAIELPGRKSDT